MKLKEIIFAIISIITIHQINAHNHWEPSKDCLNGQIEAWQCCLASEATIYLKHPKHCNLYFKCAYKYLELKQCHLGYHWSVKHQKCKKPEEAQCENTSVITTTTTSKPITTTKPSQWQLPEGCYDGFIAINECCQMSQRWYELIPDQNDCHKFYKCYKGKSYHLSCPLHFKWSNEKRKCVYSSHTSCDIKITTTTTDASAVTISESNIITVAPERLPNGCYDGSIQPLKCCKMDIGKSTEDVFIASLIGENFDLDEFNKQRHHHHHQSSSSEEKIFNNELLADPKDCHKYYKCVLGKPLHLSCAYHTKWNIQSSKCVYAINTKCTDPEPTTSTTTTEVTITETTTTTTPAPWRLPNGCYDGFITAKECCNIEIGKTIRDIKSLFAENFDLETNLRHHHHSSEEQLNWNNETLADPKDCHKYFQCKFGKPVHLSCPSHNKWSIEHGKCVYSESKKCTDLDPTTSPSTTITTEIPITTTVETITTTQAPWRLPDDCYDGSLKASQCCKIEKDKRDFIIMSLIAESFDLEDNTKHHSSSSSNEVTRNWNNETLADPKDCHKYYQCKFGKPVHISCPNHNIWNIELRKCVYSNIKKCKDLDPTTTKPTITSTEPSTMTTPPVSTTTAAPWRLPQGCYDGSFKAPNCCKIRINETMDLSSSSISSSKERQDISLKLLIAENFDLIESTKHSGSKSSEEENNFNTESLADPKNCHKYFKCENGKPIHKSCPKHTKWNIELGQCVYAIFEKCSDQEPTTKPPFTITEQTTTEITITKTVPTTIDSISTTTVETTTETNITTTESSGTETTTLDYITTTEATSSTTSYETTSIELSTTEGPTATELTTTTEWPITPDETTTPETETPTSTSDKPTTTEATTISEGPTTTEVVVTSKDPTTTETSNTSEEPTTTEAFITTEALSSTEKTTSISEETTTTEATITENPATPEVTTISEETKTTEKITTTEAISSTETATSTSEKTNTEAAITTETPTTSEETTTTEAIVTTEVISSTVTTSTSEETITTEATTEEPTSSVEITTTEIGLTTKTGTTSESITTTVEIDITTESITNNTEDASTTEAITTTEDFSTITTEIVTSTETTSTTTAKPITSTTEDGTSTTKATTNTTEELTTIETPATITTENPTTKEDTATTTEAITTSTQTTTIEDTPTPESTVSTTERSTTTEDSVTTTITATTELSNNSTTEANTDPTPDPNGSCGTASYKCRHGIISAEECCKGVPYWEDRLLQNNDNCGTYFQCVHEIPQVRTCPAGLYWNADVCRCEWKQLSTCNF